MTAFFMFILAFSSCNENELKESSVASEFENLVFSNNLNGEFENFELILNSMNERSGANDDAISLALESYKKHLKKNGVYAFETTDFRKLRQNSSDSYNQLIKNMESELANMDSSLDKNEAKSTAKSIIGKYNRIVSEGDFTNEEKIAISTIYNEYDSIYNFTVNLMGSSNGRTQFCWKRFWCFSAFMVGNAAVAAAVGATYCSFTGYGVAACAFGGIVVGAASGYQLAQQLCPSC